MNRNKVSADRLWCTNVDISTLKYTTPIPSFPSFFLPDLLSDPTSLLWREGPHLRR